MKVTAFLTNGFETVEALAVIDILRRAKVDVETVSITGDLEVKSAQNIIVHADKLFSEVDLEQSDVLFLPGGPGHKSYMECSELLDAIKSHMCSTKYTGKSWDSLRQEGNVFSRI